MGVKARKVLFALLLVASAPESFAADLTIKIDGYKNHDGVVRIAVYDAKTTFEQADLPRSIAAVQLRADLDEVTINDLPQGRYALAVHHDENSDGRVNRGLVLAKEGYGFSNGASCWSVPDFEQASFAVDGKNETVVIHLKYC
jgi:uncharacterized protein (DUF2141 family)